MGVMSDALEKKLKEALSLLSLEDCILQECSGLHEIALFFILEQILPFSFIFHFFGQRKPFCSHNGSSPSRAALGTCTGQHREE